MPYALGVTTLPHIPDTTSDFAGVLQRSEKTWKALQTVARKKRDESSVESSGDEGDDEDDDARLTGRYQQGNRYFFSTRF